MLSAMGIGNVGWFAILVIAGHALAILWHWTQRAKPYPHNTFLFHPPARFTDLTNTQREACRPNPYYPTGATPYFPLTFWILRCISSEKIVTVYRLIYCSLAVTLISVASLPWWSTAVVLFAYPALFSDDRGNIDHIVGVLSALSIWLLLSGHPLLGAALLAVPIALKGYAAPLGLMWIIERQWSGIAVLFGVVALLILLPSRTFGGGIVNTLRGLRKNLSGFHGYGVMAERGPAYSTCHYSLDIFNSIRAVHWWRGKPFDAARWARPYLAFSTAWALAMARCAWSSHEAWVALLALGLVGCVWPFTANDYRLCFLFPGVIAWLAAGAPNPAVWACLLLLWIPKHYWFPRPQITWASVSCAVSPIVVVALSVALWFAQ